MLALLGTLTVLILLPVIMLNLLSPLVALITVPIVAALIGGFGLATSKFIISGISGIAPVARRPGILDPLPDNASIALGTREVGLLEMPGAYAAFCKGGKRVAP